MAKTVGAMPLGAIISQTFAIQKLPSNGTLQNQISLEGGKAEFGMNWRRLPSRIDASRPINQKRDGEEPAPIGLTRVPEFTGGVNAVEAAVHGHEVPDVEREHPPQ